MKTIKVVAAVISDSLENPKKFLATARGYGEFKGKWEFPGGKIEVGETSQQALVREIQEELNVKIKVCDLIDTVEFDYPKFHLSMKCFLCVIVDWEIIFKEAEDAKWLDKNELYSVDWLPADRIIVERLKVKLKSPIYDCE